MCDGLIETWLRWSLGGWGWALANKTHFKADGFSDF